MAEILLAIAGVEADADGAVIAVRICDDADIQVGDVLTRLHGPTRRFDRETKQILPADPGPVHDVCLRIDSIEAYGKKFDRLSVGMTCGVRVSGRGVNLLRPSMELRADVERSGNVARLT